MSSIMSCMVEELLDHTGVGEKRMKSVGMMNRATEGCITDMSYGDRYLNEQDHNI